MSYVNDTYPAISGREYKLKGGDIVKIDLEEHRQVPEEAYKVIIYAKVATSCIKGKDEDDGELTVSTTIPNGVIERKVYCHYYEQTAWSYNSENISLPLPPAGPRFVTAQLSGPDVGGLQGSVKVVGYSK